MSSSSDYRIELDDIAVVVAAKNEENNIRACVESILCAAGAKTEVWVIDDKSTDRTAEILQSFQGKIQVVQGLGRGPGHARNVAAQKTGKPFIAFTDADAIVDERWLRELIEGFRNKLEPYVAVGGIQKLPKTTGRWAKFHSQFLESVGFVSDYVHPDEAMMEVSHNPTCNVMYIRKNFLEIGGFDENLWPCEDLDLDIRLSKIGKKFLYTSKAVVFHHRPDSFKSFMNMMKRYGYGQAQIVKKHGPCQKIHILPFVFLFLSGLGMGLLLTNSLDAFFFGCGAILVGILVGSLFLSGNSLLNRWMYGFYLLPVVLFWNIGFFSGLIQKKRITSK